MAVPLVFGWRCLCTTRDVTPVEALKGTVTALQTEIFARRYYECFNLREFDTGERFIDPQAVFTYPQSAQQFIGRAGYRELVRRWVSAFPDSNVSVINVRVTNGEIACTEWVAHGTHLGTLTLPGLTPIPPTGIHTCLKIRETIRVINAMIVESVVEFDPEDLRRRLSA